MEVETMTSGVVITGFNAFGGLTGNPSATLVGSLAERCPHYSTAVIPTSYSQGWNEISEKVSDPLTRILVMFGFANNAVGLRLEKYGRNKNNQTVPDNDGQLPPVYTDPSMPAKLETSVPVDLLAKRLTRMNHTVSVSADAGDYVCNYMYFRALSEIRKIGRDMPILFVHLGDPSNIREFEEKTAAAIALIECLDGSLLDENAEGASLQ
jgi:pyroglutamyl-peptidase